MPGHRSARDERSFAVLATRRQLLGLLAAGAVLGAGAVAARPSAARLRTRARIVIVGAGAAGISLAARLAARLDGASITIVDRRDTHHYQPGYTLVATGLWQMDEVLRPNAGLVPPGVEWVREMVAEIEPEAGRVFLESGDAVAYDYLVVAPGLALRYDLIEGMEPSLIGREGIASVYGDPAATWRVISAFLDRGGVGLFGRPPGDIKCAGAPLKMTFLTDDRLRRAGTRGRAELRYMADGPRLFGVPVYHDIAARRFAEQGVDVRAGWVLRRIDVGSRTAVYDTSEGPAETRYDLIHIVPPMTAPAALAESDLAWRDGPFAHGGWLEVDRHTLQHRRYPNVFGAGDVLGVPRGKTAASVKAQVPVVAENLVAAIAGGEPTHRYDGYTSCPLITRIGSALLVEFDYDGNLTPTFPFIDPTREAWLPWMMKMRMLKPAYLAMLRGRI